MTNVSIIVTCEEQETDLRKLLPDLLSQQYGGDYEVIVVDMKHDKDLEEWLENMEAQYSYLSHTFCPTSSRGIDPHKLALTLAAKAAINEWVIILPVYTELQNKEWLINLASNINDQIDVVIQAQKKKRHWNIFKKIFRPAFSIFRPTSSIILCRRNILLEAKTNIPKNRIIKLPTKL